MVCEQGRGRPAPARGRGCPPRTKEEEAAFEAFERGGGSSVAVTEPPGSSIKELTRRAEQGDVSSQHELGTTYAQLTRPNTKSAIKWLTLAAEAGQSRRGIEISAELIYPASAKLFRGWADYVELPGVCGGTNVAIHGISFAKPHAPESLLPKFKPPVAGAINIGIMHTSLAGSDGHNVYAPCKLAELQAFGYRYWALGHIHKRSVFKGECTVVMPGNPHARCRKDENAGSRRRQVEGFQIPHKRDEPESG